MPKLVGTIVVLLILVAIQAQTAYPAPNYRQISKKVRQPQPDLCYAYCETCQSSKNEYWSCISCPRPYLKSVPPVCEIQDPYIKEAWQLWAPITLTEQIESFAVSPNWNNSNNETKSRFCQKLLLYGPMKAGDIVTFTKILSPHDFLVIKFFFARIDWIDTDYVQFNYPSVNGDMQKLNISYIGQGNGSSQSYSLSALCDYDFNVDDTISNDMFGNIELKVFDPRPVPFQFTISFKPSANFSKRAAWGINTFIIISGQCHKSCVTCNYDMSEIGCLVCKNLLSQSPNGTCSLCVQGFYPVNNNTMCKKCPTKCQRCILNGTRVQCTVCPKNFVLSGGECKLQNKYHLVAEYELFQEKFEKSQFSIYPTGSLTITKCGEYSIVGGLGVTSSNSIIYRSYPVLPPHVSISIRFNLYKIDRSDLTGKLEVYADEVLLLNKTVMFTGKSSQCGQSGIDTLMTIESEEIQHSNENNVTLKFKTDFSAWGIRDVLVVINNCGPNCADCGPNGCRACLGYMKLVGVNCKGCIDGFVMNANKCVACRAECLTCNLQNGNCTSCYHGFTLVKGQCQLNANLRLLQNDNKTLQQSAVTFDGQEKCSPLGTQSNKLQFSTDKLIINYQELPPHSKIRIFFNLMKIDDWNEDSLNIYINDLLMVNDMFNAELKGGLRLCGEEEEPQNWLRKDLTIDDKLSRLKIEFEVVKKSEKPRTFGINNWNVLLEMCQECPNMDFYFHTSYTVDDQVHVRVDFNRPVRTFAFGLKFQDVFKIYIQNKEYPYDWQQLNPQTYLLSAKVNDVVSLSDGRLVLVCLFPTAVLTDANTVSLVSSKAEGGSQSNPMKYLNLNSSELIVSRFNRVDGTRYNSLRNILEIVSKFMLYGAMLSFLFGWQQIFIGQLHNLQKLWLTVYLCSNFLPSNYKVALGGIKIVQQMPFMSEGTVSGINQILLPANYFIEAPVTFTQYYPILQFGCSIHQIFLFALIISIIYAILIVTFRTVGWLRTNKAWLFQHYCCITDRTLWLFDSLVYFQTIGTAYAIFTQFIDTNGLVSTGVNMAASWISLIFVVLWPITVNYFIRLKAYDFMFSYKYSEICYRYYKDKQQYFSDSHGTYYLWRWFEVVFIPFVIVIIRQPYIAAVLLIVVAAIHFVWLIIKKIHNKQYKVYFYAKLVELLSFVCIYIAILICYGKTKDLDKESYDRLGDACLGFTFIIILMGFLRILYGLGVKIQQIRSVPQSAICEPDVALKIQTTDR